MGGGGGIVLLLFLFFIFYFYYYYFLIIIIIFCFVLYLVLFVLVFVLCYLCCAFYVHSKIKLRLLYLSVNGPYTNKYLVTKNHSLFWIGFNLKPSGNVVPPGPSLQCIEERNEVTGEYVASW